MKKKQIIILSVIAFLLIGYITTVVIIDPYNYFDTQMVNQDIKNRIAFPLNERLSKIIDFKKNPSPNILIGDSRIQNIRSASIKKVTGYDYYNFGYGGCNLPELIETFWFAAENQKLENVYIGISFGMYNKYNNTNLFTNAQKSSNLFNYIFNSTNFQVIYYFAKDALSKEEIVLGIPDVKDKETFWQQKIDEQTQKYYQGYRYPEDFYKSLIEIRDYCAANKINLNFFIPPEYVELHEKVVEFSLTNEYQRFVDDTKTLGRLYDFNIDNEFNRNKDNFFDPFHFLRTMDTLLIKPMFSDSATAAMNPMLKVY